MNTIVWQKKATKQLRKIGNRSDKINIYQSVQTLVNFPQCSNVKTLVNHEYSYRLRVGNYRVMFEYTSEIRIINIEEVRRRNERTY